jgi:hypothetical protein
METDAGDEPDRVGACRFYFCALPGFDSSRSIAAIVTELIGMKNRIEQFR